jgi:hypothetical protein
MTDLDQIRYWQCIARDLAGALDACTNQIEQMRGMFGDDPDIDRAMEDADEAIEAYRVAASQWQTIALSLNTLAQFKDFEHGHEKWTEILACP